MTPSDRRILLVVHARRDDTVHAAERILTAAEWFLAAHPEHQDRIWRGDIVAISIDPAAGNATARHYINAIVSG